MCSTEFWKRPTDTYSEISNLHILDAWTPLCCCAAPRLFEAKYMKYSLIIEPRIGVNCALEIIKSISPTECARPPSCRELRWCCPQSAVRWCEFKTNYVVLSIRLTYTRSHHTLTHTHTSIKRRALNLCVVHTQHTPSLYARIAHFVRVVRRDDNKTLKMINNFWYDIITRDSWECATDVMGLGVMCSA